MLKELKPITDDPQAYATILASFIGAFLAFAASYSIGLIERKLSARKEKANYNNGVLENYRNGIAAMEENLIHSIVQITKNTQLMSDIITSTENNTFFVNKPNVVQFRKGLTGVLVNNRLVNKWSTLIINNELVNSLITEFNDFYGTVTNEVHRMYLNGRSPSADASNVDREQIHQFAIELLDAHEKLRDHALNMLCEVIVHAQLNNYEETTFTDRTELRKFFPIPEHLAKIKEEQLKKYSADTMFSNNIRA